MKVEPASGMHVSEITSDQPVPVVEVESEEARRLAGQQSGCRARPGESRPRDYKVEFENSQVRVVRVKIGAHQKVPLHEHVLNRVQWSPDQNGSMTTPDGKTETAQHKAGEVSGAVSTKHRERTSAMARRSSRGGVQELK